MQAADESPTPCIVPACLVSLTEDITLAARDEGILTEVFIDEGAVVAADAPIAQLDQREAEVRLDIARAQLAVLEERRANDVEVRLAKAQAEVKKLEHENALSANRVVADVVGQVEVRRMALAFREAELQAEKARRDLDVLVKEQAVRRLEIAGAELELERRRVLSPVEGVVVQRFVDRGEWVKLGDPVCRIIRLDQLWIEGLVEARSQAPRTLGELPVSVAFERSGGGSERLTGRVVFVDPQIDGNGRFRVRALVKNRRDGKHWTLLPGQSVEMTIGGES